MKILLTAINSQFIHSNLAVRYLRAFTKDLNYECSIREFSINDREERVLEEIIKEKPNVVAFSTYIWNIEMVKRLSVLIKEVDEEIEILYGGPEVSYDSINLLKDLSGQYIIEGEGEETFREFVKYKLGLIDIRNVRGLYYKDKEQILCNGNRLAIDMNNLVFPYEEEDNLENKIVYYEGSRGCPYKCKYCLSSTTHGVRFLDIDRVKEELEFFIKKNVKLVKFVDRTFNCNKKFSTEVWTYLINQETNTKFHFEISADILSFEEMEILKKAPKGRFQFEVGVQSTNDDVLDNINRFVDFNDIKEKVGQLLEIRNIHQHLDLIVGLPNEDFNSFKKSFNDVYSIEPEAVQIGFLKLLQGSAMRLEADKYGMKFSPYAPYEVLKTSHISYEELLILKKVDHMVDKYYNSGKFTNIVKYFISKFETPFDFYLELSTFFDNKGYFSRNINNNDYYKVFLDFNMEILKSENQVLKDIIKFDYLSFNKRRGMPTFFERSFDKDEESQIKEIIREKYPLKKYSLEKFSLNINYFVKSSTVLEECSYFLFGYEGDIIDITENVLVK